MKGRGKSGYNIISALFIARAASFMWEILAFLQTGCSILSVAYYERSWRFCGYRCVSKDKLKDEEAVTHMQFYFLPGEKTLYRSKRTRLEFQLLLPYYSWIVADVIIGTHSCHPL